MFKHAMDPLCKTEFANLQALIDEHASQIATLKSDYAEVEKKLDELLMERERGSILPESGKPKEALEIGRGYTPWSQRKRQREQSHKSAAFVDKVIKSNAHTDRATEAAKPAEE